MIWSQHFNRYFLFQFFKSNGFNCFCNTQVDDRVAKLCVCFCSMDTAKAQSSWGKTRIYTNWNTVMQTWENECNSPTSSNVFLSVPSFFYHSIFMLFDAFCVYFLLTLLSLSTFHHHSRRHYFTTIKFIEYFGVQYEMSKNSPFVSESFTSILSRSVPSTCKKRIQIYNLDVMIGIYIYF